MLLKKYTFFLLFSILLFSCEKNENEKQIVETQGVAKPSEILKNSYSEYKELIKNKLSESDFNLESQKVSDLKKVTLAKFEGNQDEGKIEIEICFDNLFNDATKYEYPNEKDYVNTIGMSALDFILNEVSLEDLKEIKTKYFKHKDNYIKGLYYSGLESILNKYFLFGYFYKEAPSEEIISKYHKNNLLDEDIQDIHSQLGIELELILKTCELGHLNTSKNLRSALYDFYDKIITKQLLPKLNLEKFLEVSSTGKEFLKDQKITNYTFESRSENYLNGLLMIYNFSNCLDKGRKYWKKLNQRINNEYSVEELSQIKNKKEGEKLRFDEYYLTMVNIYSQSIQTQGTLTKEDGRPSYYTSDYDLTNSSFKCKNSFHNDGINPISFSSIIYNQINKLNKKLPQTTQFALERIIRQNIANFETNQVIEFLTKIMKYPDGNLLESNSELGLALLGTPNGRSSIWLAHDYWEELNYKKPTEISLEYDAENQTYNMLIDFK